MNILIFGASGMVGTRTVIEALQRGHTVTAFVHRTAPVSDPGLRTVQGDIYDRASIEQALHGQDAVISTLGSWKTKQKNVLSSAMTNIIPAMEQRGIRRIVSLTGNVAAAPDEKLSFAFTAAKSLLGVVAPKILRDGEQHIAQLAGSTLDWSVVRAPVITNFGSAHYALTSTGSLRALSVHRDAVAASMIDLVENGDWNCHAPYIARRR